MNEVIREMIRERATELLDALDAQQLAVRQALECGDNSDEGIVEQTALISETVARVHRAHAALREVL